MSKNMMMLCILTIFFSSAGISIADNQLAIYGNANLDKVVDEKDIAYINDIINGTIKPTDLADANCDGKIDEKDIQQIKDIIGGKEKKLYYIDIFGDTEMINKPIKRLANLGWSSLDVARAIGAEDLIVAIGNELRYKTPVLYPKISNLPAVGATAEECDFEKVLSLKPDAVQTNLEANWAVAQSGRDQKKSFKTKLPGIPIISLNMRELGDLPKNIRTYGYIVDRKAKAEEFAGWIEKQQNLLDSRTANLPDKDRKRVYFEMERYHTKGSGDRYSQAYILAGGKNIADEKVGPGSTQYSSDFDLDPEYVIEHDPEYIILSESHLKEFNMSDCGYETDDVSKVVALRNDLLTRPELANITAVKNGNVYFIAEMIIGGAGQTLIGSLYAAKIMHPDLFKDIDPQAVHQEYVDKFCNIDFDVRKRGVFVYPPLKSK